jgi:hypothetical protein
VSARESKIATGWARLSGDLRPRLAPAAVLILVLWPAIMVLSAASILGGQPFISMAGWHLRVTGATAAAGYLAPEIVGCAVVLLLVNLIFWIGLSRIVDGRIERPGGWVEPPLFLLLLTTGVISIYPAVLQHPVYAPVRWLPAGVVVLSLVVFSGALAGWVGLLRSGRPRGGVIYTAASLAVILLAALVSATPVKHRGEPMRESILLLGIDSLAQTLDLSILESMAGEPGWTWYRRAVTPGLLTNSVWPAILMNRPVRETGCFLTFQNPNWERSSYNMVREARKKGFETWSFFSDQFTCYVGTNGGFDVDRSGPKGWLQPATAAVKDGSILMPLMLPRLPRIPLSRSPRNQSGTFAYDLRREIDEILTAGNGERSVFVAAHLDYLHQPAYPGLHQLGREERIRVLKAPGKYIRDLSLDWEYPALPGEPLGLYRWKLQRIQRVVVEAFDAHGIVGPERNNRLAIFSDHGPRVMLLPHEFSARHLHNVLFATHGMDARDPSVPISLLDLAALSGLDDTARPGPAPAVVEYTHVRSVEEGPGWTMQPDGEIALDPHDLVPLGRQLLAYFPYESHRGYLHVPTIPAEMDAVIAAEGNAK